MKKPPNDTTIVVHEGVIYPGIRELGFNDKGQFIIDLHTRNDRYFNTFSVKKTDRRLNSQAGYRIINNNDIIIFDDWGTPYRFQVRSAVVEMLLKECLDNELVEK